MWHWLVLYDWPKMKFLSKNLLNKKNKNGHKLYSMTFGTLKNPLLFDGESFSISWRAKEDSILSSRKTFFRDVAYAIG